MIDPLTLLMLGMGYVTFREMNRKDYGVLNASRDERYRNAMAHCYDPQVLLQEAKLFADHGLKAQAAMLKRRAEWRSRPESVRQQHEAIYQKAMTSSNIQAVLEVAAAFEGWTATKKATALRERARVLHEAKLAEAMKPIETTEVVEPVVEVVPAEPKEPTESKEPVETAKAVEGEEKKTNGAGKADIPRNDSEGEVATPAE
jgi:hypothetical protein